MPTQPTWIFASKSIGNAIRNILNSRKMKKQPQTIADLSLNWTFDWYIDTNVLVEIQEANPEISHLKIVKNIYRFYIDSWHFPIETGDTTLLSDLIYLIDGTIFNLQESKRLPKVLVLDRFELIGENTFRIHVKK